MMVRPYDREAPRASQGSRDSLLRKRVIPGFITSIILFATALSALATSVEYSVTPKELDHRKYVFTVSKNDLHGTIAFHVMIKSKTTDFYSDSSAGLSIITRKGEGSFAIEGVKPEIPITMEKNKRLWITDFTVSEEMSKRADVYFIFAEYAHGFVNGKDVAWPSVDFYEIKLRDFINP